MAACEGSDGPQAAVGGKPLVATVDGGQLDDVTVATRIGPLGEAVPSQEIERLLAN